MNLTTFDIVMVKKAHIKFGSSFFMLALLLPIFLTFGSGAPSEKTGESFFSNKSIASQTLISLAELCEETEAKDSSESFHNTPFIQFTYSLNYTAPLVGSDTHNTHPSFASTTNLPLYLAKQVFLI